jgi:hypothetical protein
MSDASNTEFEVTNDAEAIEQPTPSDLKEGVDPEASASDGSTCVLEHRQFAGAEVIGELETASDLKPDIEGVAK